MASIDEIVIETYKKEIESKSGSPKLTIFSVLFVFGLFIWPLLLIAFFILFVPMGGAKTIIYSAVICPSCEKETLLIPPKLKLMQALKTTGNDVSTANNYEVNCQHCSSNMHYLNGHIIYKKITVEPLNTNNP